MVFGFFKKKKGQKGQAAQAAQTKDQNVPVTDQISPEKTKSSKPKSASKDKPSQVDDGEDQWVYETVAQFLRSPVWQIPILSFVDENCIIFDDAEEDNDTEHLQCHEAFKKLVEGLVNDLMNELEISEEKFTTMVQIGLKNPQDKKYFEQLLIVENFDVFKNLMIKRNKQLEVEALKQLHEQEKIRPSHEEQHMEGRESRSLQQLELEKEQAEIEHALALSLAVEKERQNVLEQEDYEMQEALRQSEAEFVKYQEVEQEKERELEREIERQRQEKERILQEQEEKANRIKQNYEEQKIDVTTSQIVKGKRLEPLSNAPKPDTEAIEHQRSSFLPPIRADTKFEPMSLDQLMQEKDRVGSKIQEMKKEEVVKGESLEERKKRLKAQRDLLLAKKKAEREAELKNYEAKKEAGAPRTADSGLSAEELERRKEIYQKLKSQL